jgi:hypothetical protein
MKKILLSIGVVLTSISLNAQLFFEDWTAPLTWTYTQNPVDMDTNFWGVASVTSLASQGNMAYSASWIDDGSATGLALTPDNILISPAINMSTVTGPVSLAFKAGSPEPTASNFYQEYLSVYVISDLTQIAAATAIHSAVLAGGEMMYPFSFDISSMAGQATVYLVFRHHNCTDENFILLDDILVTNGGLSINENTMTASVYPNPASDVLNIQLTENATSVSIIGMDGKVISTELINANTAAVNVSNLVSGVYFYEIATENGSLVRNTFVKK